MGDSAMTEVLPVGSPSGLVAKLSFRFDALPCWLVYVKRPATLEKEAAGVMDELEATSQYVIVRVSAPLAGVSIGPSCGVVGPSDAIARPLVVKRSVALEAGVRTRPSVRFI